MAIYDGGLQFSGVAGIAGSTDSPTTGTTFSNNTIDLGPGLRHIGIGDDPAVKFAVTVVTPFTGGTSLQVAVQGSVDNSTFVTMASGPVIAEANLTAGTHLFDIDLPRIVGAQVTGAGPSQALPRYLRLSYTSVGTHSQGSLFAGAVLDRTDTGIAYPVGISVPN
jgi:hypothetical protein